jgi:hypothetical protein
LIFSVLRSTEPKNSGKKEENMKKLVLSLAVAALAIGAPAFAVEKKQGKMKDESSSASMQKDANEGRGGLSEWPVSKTPADWSSAAASGSATSGDSTGASGSAGNNNSSKR